MIALFEDIPEEYFSKPIDEIAKMMIPGSKLKQLEEANLDDLNNQKIVDELKSQVTVECLFIDFRMSFLEDKI